MGWEVIPSFGSTRQSEGSGLTPKAIVHRGAQLREEEEKGCELLDVGSRGAT